MKPVRLPGLCRIALASAMLAMLSAAPAFAQTPTLDSEEWAFLTLINNYRAQNGVGPLQVSAALENSSRWMSNDMATKNYFSHTDSLGRDPFTRMKAFNYAYTPAGENIAAGTFTSDAQTAFNQWLNACDPDGSGNCTYAHRENMRYPGYVVIGIARAYNSASTYSWYWTTDFGGFLDQTVSPTNSISGRVTVSGVGLGGVAVALSGSSTASSTTDSSGNFAFNGLAGGGTYTVTPSSSAYVFSPASQSFSNLSGNQTMNFAATPASGPPMLNVVMSHAGNLTQGQAGAMYTITVSNAPTGPTSGVVTVSEVLPAGLTLVSMSGGGWSCTGVTCTRSDILNPGGSYASITVTVNVAANAPLQITNQVSVSGGGSASTSAADTTKILPLPVALGFYPVTPCRVADTRSFGGKSGAFGPPFLPHGSTRDFPILSGSCGIPATALAYSLNVTVSPHGPLGFLSIWPAGSPFPVVSTLNSFDGSVVANAAIVPAGANGAVSVYASDDTDVFIDINGYFAPPTAQALAFYPVTPCRVADTRSYGGKTGVFGPPSMGPFETRSFPIPSSACGVPSSAQAYSLNMTAWPSGPLQYLSTWPAGQAQPFVSTLNAYGGGLVANAAIVPAGAGGSISVFVTERSDVIIDINGYFAPPGPGGLYFYPVTPCRVADTRSYGGKTGAFGPPQLPTSGTRAFPVPAGACGITTAAQAYALNMTAWPTGPLGFLTTWPAGQSQPVVSTLNSLTGKVVANAAIVPAGANGGINVYVSDPADVFFDINGYFAP